MFSLLNRGIIPKDVDLSPAFERGNAPFMFLKARMHSKPDKIEQSSKYVPVPQLSLKYPK
jgi:hypothetical protein